MNAPEFFRQQWRRAAVTDLPAGRVVGLAEGADHKTPLIKLRITGQRLMPATVENDVLIHLVRQQEDPPVADNRRETVDVGSVPDRPGRVMRGVGDDETGPFGDKVSHALPVDPVLGRMHGHMVSHAALQADHRLIAVVGRVEDDHLVTRIHHGRNGAEQRLGGP